LKNFGGFIVMMYLIVAIVAAGHLTQPAQPPPPNIAVASIYHTTLATMLQYSPTFRRQFRRIANSPQLRVAIKPALLAGMPGEGAITRIVRRAASVEASVELSTVGDPVLLIAHEFEHILEQLDEVDLASMAARPATGVRTVPGSDHFETDRAIAAGRQVRAEVKRGRAGNGT
jgi:hypothetical protein